MSKLDFFKKYYKRDITEDITKLDFQKKNITTLPYCVFDRFINLHTLDLSDNNLTVLEPDTFKNNVNLHTLYLNNNNLTEIHPDTFKGNVNLHTLHLYFNNLTEIHPDTFKGNVNLHTLYLYDNKLTVPEPDTFKGNVNLDILYLSYNKLTVLEPDIFKNNVNLHTLNLYNNNLTALHPDTFKNNVNLHTLYLYYNELTVLEPNTFKNNVNLDTLYLSYNKLTVLEPDIFKNNINLHTLNLSNNNLTEIHPDTFKNNVNLHTLDLSHNNLSSLPLEIINLRNLQKFDYSNNPIENIHPILARFINDRIRNRVSNTNRGIYSDTQSVHSHAIQESVRNSIINILKDTAVSTVEETKEDIIKDDILTPLTKGLLLEYCNDTITHSSLYVTFEDLLIKVWNRIKGHASATELKNILNQEMKESECKCFTGRLSRLVNVLSGGFFDDVNVTIQSAEQIANVILTVKEKLEKEGNYTLEKHREEAVKELLERGYESEVIKVWTDEI